MIPIAAVRAKRAVVKDTIAGNFEQWFCKQFEGKEVRTNSRQDAAPPHLIYFSSQQVLHLGRRSSGSIFRLYSCLRRELLLSSNHPVDCLMT